MHKRKLFIVLAAILTISLIGLSATCKAPGEAPTIELEVYDGPEYSESDDKCYYRVEAIATGMPEPEIKISDDEMPELNNINPLGSERFEVGVEVGDTYTLTATATNSAGTASVSIILDGDCDEEATDEETADGDENGDADAAGDGDSDADGDADGDSNADGDADSDSDGDSDAVKEEPTISLEIYEGPTLEGSICYYRVRAIVDGSPDPDVTFNKDDSDGSWLPNRVQVNLNNPSDTFTLSATATNSEGSDTATIDLSWACDEPEPEPEPEVHEIPIAADPDISGYLWDDGLVELMSFHAFIGDSAFDYYSKGYFSFDISGLHGKTVQDAEINFTSIRGFGEPASLASEIVVKVFNYVRIDETDFRLGGVHLVDIPISASSYTITGSTFKSELQAVLDNEVRDYFQLKLGLNVTTNSNGSQDGIIINWSDTILNITYTD